MATSSIYKQTVKCIDDDESKGKSGKEFPSSSVANLSEQDLPQKNSTTITEANKPTPRRSGRDINRIQLSPNRNGALQYHRMEELFFEERQRQKRKYKRHRPSPEKLTTTTAPPTTNTLTTLNIGNITLNKVFEAPNIYMIDDFLSATDLQYLHQRIRLNQRQFQKSFVDSTSPEDGKSLLDDQHRTSTFLSFAKQENAKVAAIETKAASLLGYFSTDQIEPLQLVRYAPGQFFGIHHDMGDLDESTGEVALPPKSVVVKRRLVTIFCYLNDLPPEAGGCTYFPECQHLQVSPKAGRAVVFCNIRKDGSPDPRTVHAGQVVNCVTDSAAARDKDGKTSKKTKRSQQPCKYGLNIWICEN